MSFLIVVASFATALFVLSYLRAGRFGPTMLALGAGYLLAEMWASRLGYWLEVEFGGSLFVVSWQDVAYGALVLLPGLLALLFASKQKSVLPRFMASAIIGVFAVVLLLPVLSVATILDANSRLLHMTVQQHQAIAMTIGLVLGLVDILFSRLPKTPRRRKD